MLVIMVGAGIVANMLERTRCLTRSIPVYYGQYVISIATLDERTDNNL